MAAGGITVAIPHALKDLAGVPGAVPLRQAVDAPAVIVVDVFRLADGGPSKLKCLPHNNTGRVMVFVDAGLGNGLEFLLCANPFHTHRGVHQMQIFSQFRGNIIPVIGFHAVVPPAAKRSFFFLRRSRTSFICGSPGEGQISPPPSSCTCYSVLWPPEWFSRTGRPPCPGRYWPERRSGFRP